MSAIPPDHRGNSFTFLRLMLALMVVFGHSYVLGGFGEEPLTRWSGDAISGRELAVQGFFILSGYLLANSLFRQPSLARFGVRRAFRILPAYWIALLITCFAAAPALFATLYPGRLSYSESLTIGDYNALGYLGKNALLWQGQKWILPLFLNNDSPGVVNGSLWSLFYEALCYFFLAAGAFLGWAKRRWVVLSAFALLYVPCLIHAIVRLPSLPKGPVAYEIFNMAFHPAGPCVMLAFVAGVAARLLSNGGPVWNARWFVIAAAVFAISLPIGAARITWPIALPFLLLALGERLPFRKLEAVGDFSYGIYIYSFLIQQSLFAFGWQHRGFWPFFSVSLGLSVAAGAASWFLIEKSAIRIGQRISMRLAISGNIPSGPALPFVSQSANTP